MARWFAIILLATMLTASHAEEKTPANDCEQEGSWKEWQELLAKHPEDSGLQTLHALRIGLCVKIRRGELSVKQGTEIFEKARQALLIERQAAAPKPSSKLLKP